MIGVTDMVELVRETAKIRNETPVPDPYIVEALRLIRDKKIKVECYPTGAPSLSAVYRVAKKLFFDQTSN